MSLNTLGAWPRDSRSRCSVLDSIDTNRSGCSTWDTCPLTFVVASLIANLFYDIYQIGHAFVINHADALIESGAYFPVVLVGSLGNILVSYRNRDETKPKDAPDTLFESIKGQARAEGGL